MQQKAICLGFVFGCLLTGPVNAIDIDHQYELVSMTRDLCSGDLKAGYELEELRLVNGDLELKIIGPKGAAVEGAYHVKKSEIGERRKLLPEQEEAAEIRFHECVKFFYTRHLNDAQMAEVKKK